MDLKKAKKDYQQALAEYQNASEEFYKNGVGTSEMLESKRQKMLIVKKEYDEAFRLDEERKREEEFKTEIEMQKKAEKIKIENEGKKIKVQELLLCDDPSLDTCVSTTVEKTSWPNSSPWNPFGNGPHHYKRELIITLREKMICELLDLTLIEGQYDLKASDFKNVALKKEHEGVDQNNNELNELGKIYINRGGEYETTSKIAQTMKVLIGKSWAREVAEFKTYKQIEQEMEQEEERKRMEAERKYKNEHPVKYRLSQIKEALSKRRERGE